MLNWLSNYRDLGLLFLRGALGIMMVLHGWPKLAGGLSAWVKLGRAMGHLGVNFFPGFWGFACVMTETLGGALLVAGFLSRPVAILMMVNFLVATIMLYKTGSSFTEWSRPFELAIVFFGLIFVGPGKYSVDRS